MTVKELIKLLRKLDQEHVIKLEDTMHNVLDLEDVVKGRIVHDHKDCYIISPFVYGGGLNDDVDR